SRGMIVLEPLDRLCSGACSRCSRRARCAPPARARAYETGRFEVPIRMPSVWRRHGTRVHALEYLANATGLQARNRPRRSLSGTTITSADVPLSLKCEQPAVRMPRTWQLAIVARG